MTARLFAAAALFRIIASAQTVCPPTRIYTPCDLIFDSAQSPDLQAEFRSPKANTVLAHAFSDGGSKWVIRFTPTEAGTYTYRLNGGKQGEVTAIAAENPGWLRAANLHHFAYVEGNVLTPHLYMGAVVPAFSSMDLARWKTLVDTRAAQHFNHLAVTLVDQSASSAFRTPEFFQTAEQKILYANQHGVIVDLAFFGPGGMLGRLLPSSSERRTWFTYALSRLAAFDVVWQGIEAWETDDNGRALTKEIGEYLSTLDPYKHTRTTRTLTSSAPLMDDGWLRIRSYETSDDAIGGIEQQTYQYPAINNFAADASNADSFRHRLWNATMNGQYPATAIPDETSANAMKIWYEFMQSTRHWELEQFFDVDNGRGLQLEGIEYVIYAEKPGPVTATVEKHGYDVEWFNPATGEHSKVKDACKNETCTATPPSAAHDWVLHISRESTKAGMLKSVKFDSREENLKLQDIEGNPDKIPFDIAGPDTETLSLSKPAQFSVKMKRQSKALQHMSWLWTGEVTVSGRGYRVIATGADGTFQIPANIAETYPAALHVKLYGMNGLGKVYALDRNYTLAR